jgi:PAS domain S-box-containing protein
MNSPLRILYLEDDAADAELVRDTLATEGIACEVTRVDTEPAFLAGLQEGGYDLILADYSLPSFDGMSALRIARKERSNVPFIFVSGTLGEEVAIEALKIGATDYVVKTRLTRLVPAVHRALRESGERAERKKAEEALRQSEAYLAEAQRLSRTGSFGWNVTTGEIYWSEETYNIFEYDRTAKPTLQLVFRRIHPEDVAFVQQIIERGTSAKANLDFEHRLLMPNGSVKHLRVLARVLESSSIDLEYAGAVMDVTAAKQAENALRESEAYLAEAQRLTRTGSWVWRVAGRDALHLSEEWYRIYGFDPRDGVPNWQERLQRVHPEDRAKWESTIDRAVADKSDYEVEFRIVTPNGNVKHIYTVGHPVVSASGDLVEFVGSSVDVTERKRDEALREGESCILEMIARDAPVAETLEGLVRVVECQFTGLLCSVLLLDEDGQHVRHGAAPSLPKPYVDAINGLPIGPKAGSCGTAMYRGQPVIVTDILEDPLWEPYRGVVEPHGLRACWSTPILAHSGKVLGSFAMYYREPRSPTPAEKRALDMATHLAGIAIERKLTHEQLHRSEAYLAEAQRLSQTGSWAFNSRGPVYWSEENYQIWGFDPEQGLPSREATMQRIHPDDRDRVLEYVLKAIREKTDYAVEFRLVLPDGTVKHVNGLGHPVFDGKGNLVEVIGTLVDVTERRRADEERERLRQLEADLAHINRVSMMGELAASLAHELKQPISAVSMNASTCMRWLRRDPPDTEEARETALMIVEDVTRAAAIIDRVRSLYSRSTPNAELLDLNEIIREMIVLLQDRAIVNSVSIRTSLDALLPKICADRVQVQQVLMNLMLNGIEAMGMGGELTISSTTDEHGQALISVSDQGVGLPAKDPDRIFQTFYTTKTEGSGMGLSISRRIIESHGGRLWATSNRERGATFHFTLPRAARTSSPAA